MKLFKELRGYPIGAYLLLFLPSFSMYMQGEMVLVNYLFTIVVLIYFIEAMLKRERKFNQELVQRIEALEKLKK